MEGPVSEVSELLVKWGYPDLVSEFEAQQFDLDSLCELDNDSLSLYVPAHGPRLKLLKHIRELKQSYQSVEVLLVDSQTDLTAFNGIASCSSLAAPASDAIYSGGCSSSLASSSESIEHVPPPPKRQYEEVVLEETLVKTALEALNIKEVLEGDALCKHALAQLAKGLQPTGHWRNRIVDTLVSQSILQISRHLSLAQLRAVAVKLVDLLPGEQLSTYYLEADHTRRLVSGKLVDKFNNLKSKFKDKDTNKRQRSSSAISSSAVLPSSGNSYSSEERQQSLAWLRFNRSPWPEVRHHWDVVYQDRVKLLYPRPDSKKENNIEKYYSEFPVLTDKAGWQLMVADFEKLYPDKSGRLFAAWPTIEEAILLAARETAKDPFATALMSQLQSARATESGKIILLLMLIPSLFKTNTSVQIPNSSGSKKYWKPSLAESRDGFIMHVKDANDIKKRLETRQSLMQSLGLKCQPLVIVCGPSLSEFTHCQVSVNGILYTVPGPLQAVDLAFKSFQVLNAWYPVECDQAWLFIQKEIFKITTRFDKTTAGYLTSLGSFQKYLNSV